MPFLICLVFCVLRCSGQDYSLGRDEYISEESYERINLVFNTSSKEAPARLHYDSVQVTGPATNTSDNQTDGPPDGPAITPTPGLSNCIKRTKSTKGNDYPFSVSIQRKAAHYATGALIHNKWILSAAGPFYNVRESIKLYRALLGTVFCKRSGQVVPIKNIEVHPSYRNRKPSFDLALLQLAVPVVYSNLVKPVPLSKVKAKVISAKFLTTYWPRLIVKGAVVPQTAQERVEYNSLRVSTQQLVPWERCAATVRALGAGERLHNTSLCLNSIHQYHSPCMPDVGAPVLAEDGLWGITSGWAPSPCPSPSSSPSPGADALVPTVFTRVSPPSISSWILSLTLAY